MDAWDRLVAALDAWGSAAEVAPGRIEVVLPGSGRRVVVVMTPEEWSDMAGVMWGSVDAAIRDVEETLLGLQPLESYAVYSEYRLEPSTGPSLPEEEDLPTGPGEWVVLDEEGRVVSRFSEWRDPDDNPPD